MGRLLSGIVELSDVAPSLGSATIQCQGVSLSNPQSRRYAVRLAELSDSTGVAVATLKYYLREGLLHPGRTVSRTQADYDETHVDRVRLVRALIEVGGMSLAAVKRVLDVLTTPGEQRLEVLEAAQ